MSEDEYYTIRSSAVDDIPVRSRPRPLRAALLFATAAVALTVLVTPQVSERLERRLPDAARGWVSAWDATGQPGAPSRLGIDERATGSVPRRARDVPPRPGDGSTYVVRRSVLSEGSVCVINQRGARDGNC